MDEARRLLDSLMGNDRNAGQDEKKQSFKDGDVCKYYLVGDCPHEMFVNQEGKTSTVSPIGPCRRQHSEAMKQQLLNDKEYPYYRKKYLRELFNQLDKLHEDIKRKIKATEAKIQDGASSKAETAETVEGHVEAREALVKQKMEAAEKLAQAGDLSASQNIMKDADDLAHHKYRLTRLKEVADSWLDDVCLVCGYQQSWRAQEEIEARSRGRPHPHIVGAWHLGCERVRLAWKKCDEELKSLRGVGDDIQLVSEEKKEERPAPSREARRSRSRSRRGGRDDRGRPRDDRGRPRGDRREADRRERRSPRRSPYRGRGDDRGYGSRNPSGRGSPSVSRRDAERREPQREPVEAAREKVEDVAEVEKKPATEKKSATKKKKSSSSSSSSSSSTVKKKKAAKKAAKKKGKKKKKSTSSSSS